MITKNLWRPDTCGCEVEYEWDTEVAPDDREYTVVRSELCTIHKDLGLSADTNEHYVAIKEENTRKNIVFKHIVETIPDFTYIDSSNNENFHVEDYHWVFDDNRNLKYSLTKGTQNEKNTVDSKATDDFGNKAVMTTLAEVDALK